MTNISYKLVQPEKVIKQGTAWGVVLPTGEIDLTVIAGHSPCMVKFGPGIIKIVDDTGKISEQYFAREGIATIAGDVCVAASESVLAKEKVSLQDALEKAKDDPFFEMVADILSVE